MAAQYFVDAKGKYIGGFDGVEPPEGAIEVPTAPEDARQTWSSGAWGAPPVVRRTVLKSIVQSRIIDAGKMGQAYATLTANPIFFPRWFAPDRPEIYADDLDAVGLIRALGLDPAVILAPLPS